MLLAADGRRRFSNVACGALTLSRIYSLDKRSRLVNELISPPSFGTCEGLALATSSPREGSHTKVLEKCVLFHLLSIQSITMAHCIGSPQFPEIKPTEGDDDFPLRGVLQSRIYVLSRERALSLLGAFSHPKYLRFLFQPSTFSPSLFGPLFLLRPLSRSFDGLRNEPNGGSSLLARLPLADSRGTPLPPIAYVHGHTGGLRSPLRIRHHQEEEGLRSE